ncbi:MAG: translation elongation factor Ts [Saccharofermentanales bacterium]|nr:translation elongation factor Ts [Eubacteriales bacterium]MDD3610801.1 translation elongation factor Ts [Eubacteriales bacterium]HHU04761.1 translation elongation factor Ts [Fastidiosipila sp.]
MKITAQMVKELREMTGAPMMDCKKALSATDGDMDAAVKWLREQGIASAEKKSGRITAEGIVDSYIHGEGRIGVLLEVNIETDFAAKNEDFRKLVKDIAMQIAAMSPRYVRREEVPQEVLEQELEIAKETARKEGKPEHIIEKIAEGKVEKFYSEFCLLEQAFIRDDSKTVDQVVKELIAIIGENISVRRFARFEMGEGLEKRDYCDFAEEVAAQLK